MMLVLSEPLSVWMAGFLFCSHGNAHEEKLISLAHVERSNVSVSVQCSVTRDQVKMLLKKYQPTLNHQVPLLHGFI